MVPTPTQRVGQTSVQAAGQEGEIAAQTAGSAAQAIARTCCLGKRREAKLFPPDEMTSRDYYFDSYAHFGIHEVNVYILRKTT